jgi:hypothetical protein
LHALASQIAHVTHFGRQNRPRGQDSQSEQVSQITRVRFVATMLEPIVFFIAVVCARWTVKRFACRPSTSQYQL